MFSISQIGGWIPLCSFPRRYENLGYSLAGRGLSTGGRTKNICSERVSTGGKAQNINTPAPASQEMPKKVELRFSGNPCFAKEPFFSYGILDSLL